MKNFNFSFFFLNNRGNSLIQVVIVAGILATVMGAAMSFFSNQTKANNFLEFQAKRTQLRLTILGQFLNNPDNCRCLFAGAPSFATPGPSNLTGVAPTSVGRFNIITPGVCPGSPPPSPWIDNAGKDGMVATSIELNKIMLIGGNYSGELLIKLRSTKAVLGPDELPLAIPVAINTTPAGAGLVNFVSCSADATSGGVIPVASICPVNSVSTGFDPLTGAIVCQPIGVTAIPSICPANLVSVGFDPITGVQVCQPPAYQ